MNWVRTAGFTSVMAAIALMGCGGGSGGSPSYTIGGNVTGLSSGKSVVLLNNGNESLDATSNGAFAFKTTIEAGKPYNVTVSRQPDGQTCAITNGQGSVSNTVTDIQVQCADVDAGSAACFDNPQLRTPGNTYTVVNSDASMHFAVDGVTTWNGHSVVQTSSYSNPDIKTFSFANVVDGKLLNYGSYLTVGILGRTNEKYYEPGRGFPISLTRNQTYTAQGEQGLLGHTDPNFSGTWRDTVIYLGRETITTAFGSFETCKMRYTTEDMSASGGGGSRFETWDSWLVGAGKLAGLSVQQKTETGTTQPKNITVSWD